MRTFDRRRRPNGAASWLLGLALGVAGAPMVSAAGNPEAAAPPRSEMPVRALGYIDDYAELNAQRDGVVVLPSGLQYEVLASGEGRRPGPDEPVAVRYRGFLSNGVEFDSTGDAPAVLSVGQLVVPGLREALGLMREGDEWRVTVPAALGYSGGRLLRKRDLIYEILLVEVSPSAPALSDGEP